MISANYTALSPRPVTEDRQETICLSSVTPTFCYRPLRITSPYVGTVPPREPRNNAVTHRISRRSMLKASGSGDRRGRCRYRHGRGRLPGDGGGHVLRAPRHAAHPGRPRAHGRQGEGGRSPLHGGLRTSSPPTPTRRAPGGPDPQATIIRGGTGAELPASSTTTSTPPTRTRCAGRSAATTAHGDTAARHPQRLVGHAHQRHRQRRPRSWPPGIYGYQFANAAELMRGYAGFDLDRFQDDDAERLLPDQQPLPDQPQRRLHHQLLGQLGPVQHGLDPGHRHPLRRRGQVRPGRQLLQERRGQRLHQARRPVRATTTRASPSGRSRAATRATP